LIVPVVSPAFLEWAFSRVHSMAQVQMKISKRLVVNLFHRMTSFVIQRILVTTTFSAVILGLQSRFFTHDRHLIVV
jgi:hypothetical protein